MKVSRVFAGRCERNIAVGVAAVALTYTTSALALTNDQRIQAAADTVANNQACTAISPFYWEIGDQNGPLTSSTGTHSYGTGGTAVFGYSSAPDPDNDVLSIYSAGKLVFGAYVAQLKNGSLSSSDLEFMRMRSGYPGNGANTNGNTFSSCGVLQTVNGCYHKQNNDDYDANTLHKFNYGGGHFQAFAALPTSSGGLGLGSDYNGGLADEINTVLGIGSDFSFANPGPAGGMKSTTHNYTDFLQAILGGQLVIKSLLGTNAVATTGTDAIYTPAVYTDSNGNQVELNYHYSIGHWVEDATNDPVGADDAFSSAGAAGFYPWIDHDKQYYGVVARQKLDSSSYIDSVICGKLIRKAWDSGTQQ